MERACASRKSLLMDSVLQLAVISREYQLNPSDDKIASQLWFKTLQKAESSGNVLEQRIFLKQINPAMFKMYMKKKGA